MENKDIETVKGIYESLTVMDTSPYEIKSPAQEVENSLVGFLKHRLSKLKEDVDFEDDVKNAVLSRISEASFPQLITLLEVLQKNSNIGVEKVLAPFIAASGEKTILDTTKSSDRRSQKAEEIFEETNDKGVLQSLTMLNQLMDIMNKPKEEESNEEILD